MAGQNLEVVNTGYGFYGGLDLRNTLDCGDSVYGDSDPGSGSIIIGNSVGDSSLGDLRS